MWKHSISPLTYPSSFMISRTVMVLVWQLQRRWHRGRKDYESTVRVWFLVEL